MHKEILHCSNFTIFALIAMLGIDGFELFNDYLSFLKKKIVEGAQFTDEYDHLKLMLEFHENYDH